MSKVKLVKLLDAITISPTFGDSEGDPSSIGTTADGISIYAARRDHIHAGSHTALSNIGTNTHGVIDTHIAAANPHSGSESITNKATSFVTVNDTLYPSVQAVKTYADGLVVGLLDDRGSYDASVNTFPASGGSGTAGAILKGDLWYISVAGTLVGVAVTIGDSVRALVDTPGQTATKWSVLESNIGFVPGNVANPLSQFAATSSAQLAGVISDETGSGALVFATSPTIITPIISGVLDINKTVAAGANNLMLTLYNPTHAADSRAGLTFQTGNNRVEAYIQGKNDGLGDMDLDINGKTMIKASGKVGIGTTGPTYQLQLSTDSAAKPTSNTWTIASDERLKTNIQDFTDGLSTLLAIRPRTYQYNGRGGVGYDDKETHIGIIAQELEPVALYMVGTFEGKLDGVDTVLKNYQGHALPFIITKAIQEFYKEFQNLIAKVSGLEARLNDQELRIKALEAKLNQ